MVLLLQLFILFWLVLFIRFKPVLQSRSTYTVMEAQAQDFFPFILKWFWFADTRKGQN